MDILNVPPTKQQGQRSLDVSDAYLARFVPSWNSPPTFDASAWRRVVRAQEIAGLCKETLISSILALDWKITPIDSSMQDELAATIKYYTKLFSNASGLDYSDLVEWVGSELLDTPFGGMAELGRDGDKPNGRVRWIEPLDSATLYPTLNKDFPVIQFYGGTQVAFPEYAMSRIGMTPRTDILYKGWYVAPPEKIYMAMQMLSRGDTYYANLLLDIPTTGILDLGDMEKESAIEWVDAYKGLLANGGNGSFKIPVLYEHNNDVKYIPFGKVPNDIMFDRITLRYAAVVCAGYGMTLSDIGIQTTSSGGETLAGTIRSERKTRRNGYARLKKKLKAFFEKILPPTLQFAWIDFDDEVNAALGRSRLANASAFKLLRDTGVISVREVRQQLVADGMFTISMPEEPPAEVEPKTQPATDVAQRKPNIMSNPPVPASAGGHGEKLMSVPTDLELRSFVAKVLETVYDELYAVKSEISADELPMARIAVTNSILSGEVNKSLHGVNCDWIKLSNKDDELFCEELVKKSVTMALKDAILSDDGLDFSDTDVYDTLLEAVTMQLSNELEGIVAVGVQTKQGV
jgi:hypothetical protein